MAKAEVIEGMPFETYLALPRLSQGLLWEMKKSPWHYRQALTTEKEQTREMLLGRAYHTLVLETEKFEDQYYVDPSPPRPDVDGRSKAGKAAIAEWSETCAVLDRQVNPTCKLEKLSPIEFAMLTQMAHGVREVPQFEAAMNFDPKVETVILWEDKVTGIECKARLDVWNPKSGVVMDLKTVAEADRFGTSCARYGYHLQDAFYGRGIEAVTGELPAPMVFVLSEKAEPYASDVTGIDDESRERALFLLDDLLVKVDDCARAGEWPRFEKGIKTTRVPMWGF